MFFPYWIGIRFFSFFLLTHSMESYQYFLSTLNFGEIFWLKQFRFYIFGVAGNWRFWCVLKQYLKFSSRLSSKFEFIFWDLIWLLDLQRCRKCNWKRKLRWQLTRLSLALSRLVIGSPYCFLFCLLRFDSEVGLDGN